MTNSLLFLQALSFSICVQRVVGSRNNRNIFLLLLFASKLIFFQYFDFIIIISFLLYSSGRRIYRNGHWNVWPQKAKSRFINRNRNKQQKLKWNFHYQSFLPTSKSTALVLTIKLLWVRNVCNFCLTCSEKSLQ